MLIRRYKKLPLVFILLLQISLFADICPKRAVIIPFDGLVIPVLLNKDNKPDLDCDGIEDEVDNDIDGDGVDNAHDAFPRDKNETIDTDNDGIGNNADSDDDNDGYSDAQEIEYGSNPLDSNDIPIPKKQNFNITETFGNTKQVHFGINLTKKPTNNVIINLKSLDESISKPTKNQITFTKDNWNERQYIDIDIIDKVNSTYIKFESIISQDSNFHNAKLDNIQIVPYVLDVIQPIDWKVYSEFNLSLPINYHYVGDYEDNITFTLLDAPNGMSIDESTQKLSWIPKISDEGKNYQVTIKISDGFVNRHLTYTILVAKPKILQTSIQNNKLTIIDSNSSLKGLTIEPLEDMNLSDYRLYSLEKSQSPKLNENDTQLAKTLLVKGNIGKRVKLSLNIKNLIAKDKLISFRIKGYLGSGIFNRIDYKRDYKGSMENPIYEIDTRELFGVTVFTEESQLPNKSTKGKYKTKSSDFDKIHCEKKKFTIKVSDYNITQYEITDDSDQICTFDEKPGFKLQIFDYPKADISQDTQIEEVASWTQEVQDKLDSLNMPYDNYFAVAFGVEESKNAGETYRYAKDYWFSFVDIIFFDIIKTFKTKIAKGSIYLNVSNSKYLHKVTFAHEYFHHSQYEIMNDLLFKSSLSDWFIEATAVWFEDFVANDDFRAYEYYENRYGYSHILKEGLMDEPKENDFSPYENALFFEMLEGHCSDFKTNLRNLFVNYTKQDLTGAKNFKEILHNLNCDFKTPVNNNFEKILSTKLMYYQYATAIKKDSSLINSKGQTPINFADIVTISEDDDWESEANNVPLYEIWNDTTAQTIKFESSNTKPPRCYSKYIEFVTNKNILISIASDDDGFRDEHSANLGDTKNTFFTLEGKISIFYPRGQNNLAPIYSEIYVTLIGMPQGTENNTSNEVIMTYGTRRTNILSKVDGYSFCQDYLPSTTKNSVHLQGTIASLYRDMEMPQYYIDIIKVTDENSGVSYIIPIDENNTWEKTVNYTYNSTNNIAPIIVRGYNAQNLNKSIVQNTLNMIKRW